VQEIFDPASTARFRARAVTANAPGADFLLAHIAVEMADRLAFVDRKFENAAITSGNDAYIPSDFLNATRHQGLNFAEGSKDWPSHSEERLDSTHCDLDLALSFLSLHETNDTPGALVQIRNTLRPDGLFMGVMPGGNTLHELRQCLLEAETEITGGASPRVYPFADVKGAGALLQRAGFALPVADSETITVRYRDMFALIKDLRCMGASNALLARAHYPAKRSIFIKAAQIYLEKFGQEDGKVPATFTFIWMSGWAPADTQQKPAKRGSATVSLAKIL
jgi:SAM-dependent methyltransferase